MGVTANSFDLGLPITYRIFVSNEHSFTITLKNNATEKEGIDYLLSADRHFIFPDKESRKKIIEALGLSRGKSRTFDLLYSTKDIDNQRELLVNGLDNITLIELKTTKKKLLNNPQGFFFGATESEFELARKLGDKYKFCFVCLHSESKSYKLLTLRELEALIKTKRTQYQINL